jgi:hypothetical protein
VLKIAHASYPHREYRKCLAFCLAIEVRPGDWQYINTRLLHLYLDTRRAELVSGTVALNSRPIDFYPGAFV